MKELLAQRVLCIEGPQADPVGGQFRQNVTGRQKSGKGVANFLVGIQHRADLVPMPDRKVFDPQAATGGLHLSQPFPHGLVHFVNPANLGNSGQVDVGDKDQIIGKTRAGARLRSSDPTVDLVLDLRLQPQSVVVWGLPGFHVEFGLQDGVPRPAVQAVRAPGRCAGPVDRAFERCLTAAVASVTENLHPRSDVPTSQSNHELLKGASSKACQVIVGHVVHSARTEDCSWVEGGASVPG